MTEQQTRTVDGTAWTFSGNSSARQIAAQTEVGPEQMRCYINDIHGVPIVSGQAPVPVVLELIQRWQQLSRRQTACDRAVGDGDE